jgi:hypothetical protein
MLGGALQRVEVAVALGVFVVDPGQAGGNLVLTGIAPKALNIGHGAPVAVAGAFGDAGLDLVAQLGERLPRALSEGLGLLGRINRSDPHLYLLIGPRLAAAGGESVAIGDGDYEANEGIQKSFTTT